MQSPLLPTPYRPIRLDNNVSPLLKNSTSEWKPVTVNSGTLGTFRKFLSNLMITLLPLRICQMLGSYIRYFRECLIDMLPIREPGLQYFSSMHKFLHDSEFKSLILDPCLSPTLLPLAFVEGWYCSCSFEYYFCAFSQNHPERRFSWSHFEKEIEWERACVCVCTHGHMNDGHQNINSDYLNLVHSWFRWCFSPVVLLCIDFLIIWFTQIF